MERVVVGYALFDGQGVWPAVYLTEEEAQALVERTTSAGGIPVEVVELTVRIDRRNHVLGTSRVLQSNHELPGLPEAGEGRK